MSVNRGKQLEEVVQKAFEKVNNVSVTRLHDQTTGFKGSTNPCDFLVFHKPYLYAIECKSVHGNTFPIYSKNPKKKYGNVSNFQWETLLEMSNIKGVHAGLIIWFVDKDETLFLDIRLLERWRNAGHKSIHSYPEWIEYVQGKHDWCYIVGRKKRVLYDYNMVQFLREMEDKT